MYLAQTVGIDLKPQVPPPKLPILTFFASVGLMAQTVDIPTAASPVAVTSRPETVVGLAETMLFGLLLRRGARPDPSLGQLSR